MKKFIFLLALLCFKRGVAQVTEHFELATFKAPKGWKKEANAGMVSYQSVNTEKNIFCMINIHASILSSGTAAEVFAKMWEQLAAKPFSIADFPAKDSTSDGHGRKIITGTAGFVTGSIHGTAILAVYAGFGKSTSILTLTNDAVYNKTIEDFFSNFRLKEPEPPKPIAVPVQPVTPNKSYASSGNSLHKTNQLVGVWNGINLNLNITPFGMNHLATNTPIWITFFDNGRVFNMLPDNMNSFNKNADDLGYYQISNGVAGLQWFKGTDLTKIEFIDKDRIRVHAGSGDQTYSRCVSVDGLKLEGAWTSFDNTKDPELDAPGVKPQIHFSKNGRFTDDGIFMTAFYDVHTQPGSGMYSINNFTLSLQYDNGTTQQASFTGFINCTINTNSEILFIGRNKFHKR